MKALQLWMREGARNQERPNLFIRTVNKKIPNIIITKFNKKKMLQRKHDGKPGTDFVVEREDASAPPLLRCSDESSEDEIPPCAYFIAV